MGKISHGRGVAGVQDVEKLKMAAVSRPVHVPLPRYWRFQLFLTNRQ